MYRTIGSTGQLDATVLGHISDKIILGLSYRSGAALTGIAGLTFNNFLISYSYDYGNNQCAKLCWQYA